MRGASSTTLIWPLLNSRTARPRSAVLFWRKRNIPSRPEKPLGEAMEARSNAGRPLPRFARTAARAVASKAREAKRGGVWLYVLW